MKKEVNELVVKQVDVCDICGTEDIYLPGTRILTSEMKPSRYFGEILCQQCYKNKFLPWLESQKKTNE